MDGVFHLKALAIKYPSDLFEKDLKQVDKKYFVKTCQRILLLNSNTKTSRSFRSLTNVTGRSVLLFGHSHSIK